MTIRVPIWALVLGIAGVAGAAVATQLPEVRRYLKVKTM